MRSIKVKLGLFAALIAFPVQASAGRCVTAAEANAFMSFAMPDVLDGVLQQCRSHVAVTGFFSKSGAGLVEKYRRGQDSHWPGAKAAFFKIADNDPGVASLKIMPDSVVKPLVSFGATAKATNEIKSDDCGKIERMVEAMAPLPPENTATIVSALLEIAATRSTNKAANGLAICAPSAPVTASK